MSTYTPPVYVHTTSVDRFHFIRAVDAVGTELGPFVSLGELGRAVRLDDVVVVGVPGTASTCPPHRRGRHLRVP